MFLERSFENKLRSGCPSDTGEISRKNLDVMKEAMVQTEEAAAEITRKLEKQEKKCLKKFEKAGCNCPGFFRKY